MHPEKRGAILRVLIAGSDALGVEPIARALKRIPCPIGIVRLDRVDGVTRPICDGMFDLVFVQLADPAVDSGPVRAVKATAPRTPVAVLAPNASAEAVRSAVCAGASGLLPIPAAPAAVRYAVELMLSGGLYLPPRATTTATGWRQAPISQPTEELRLTRRQAAVLRGMIAGRTEREIARDLGLTVAVVRLHRGAVMAMLGRDKPSSDVEPLAAPELIDETRNCFEDSHDTASGEAPAADLLDSLFNAVPAPLLITQAAGPVGFPQIVYVNDHFCEFYGLNRPTLLQSTTQIITGPKTSPARLRAMRRQVSDAIFRMPMTAYDARGEEKPVRIDIARFPHGPAAGEGELWLALHVPLFGLDWEDA